jgi:GPH family glycoside/pentoside/hexuronide:cation symporter
LSFYISTFYWGFSTSQVGLLAASVVISAILSFFITPWISRVLGKKHGAMMIGLLAFTLAPLPVALRLFDLMPDNGSSLLFPIVLIVAVIDVAFIISFQTLSASMVADLVEEGELKTRRRSEGVFFAVITFTRKMTQGLGVVAATAILTVIEFPVTAMPGDLPAETVFKLGAYYAPTVLVLWALMLLCLSLYTIDRQQHQRNLKALGRA